MVDLMKAFIAFFCLFVFFLGCVSKPAEQPPASYAGEPLQNETSALTTDLNDFSDLQDSLNDTALVDSGIDSNSFS